MPEIKSTRNAFTLIELITALILASMLLILVMGLTGRISRTQRGMVASVPDRSWQTRLMEHLQSDFENCRSVSVQADRVVFEGYSIPKSTAFSEELEIPAGHVPTQIIYETANSDQHSWLIRRENWGSRSNIDNESTALMVCGITRFRSLDSLETDSAPPILRLSISGPAMQNDESIQMNLVRHGGLVQ